MKAFKIKFFYVLAILFFHCAGVNAQGKDKELVKDNYDEGFRLGFGVNVGYMFDDPFAGLGLGGDVRLQYDLSKRTSLTLTTGYNHFFISNDDDFAFNEINDVGMIPLKVGFKAFFWEDQFYALGELGAGFTVSDSAPYDSTNVILAPGIGWASKYIDLSIRYERYVDFETGQIALRLAYGFKL